MDCIKASTRGTQPEYKGKTKQSYIKESTRLDIQETLEPLS